MEPLVTERTVLRSWQVGDAQAARAVYGAPEVARWLTPAMRRIDDDDAMRAQLEKWITEGPELLTPYGNWAVTRAADGLLVGGIALRELPPYREDIEIAWQLAPEHWGHGYATEAAQSLAAWAFEQGAEELFAVVRPANTRAAAVARRIGMEHTGVTDKYYDLTLQVYRLRPDDLATARA